MRMVEAFRHLIRWKHVETGRVDSGGIEELSNAKAGRNIARAEPYVSDMTRTPTPYTPRLQG